MKKVERRTTIVEGAAKVHTVEHVLSALAGLGVDNALIEMDANEPPIGDGSAQPYRRADQESRHRRAGRAARRITRSPSRSIIETKSGSLMTDRAGSAFRISCTQVGPEGRFTQFYSTEITPAIYEKEIAPARTFVFYEDVKPLMDKGLIKGGSLENAVVVRGEHVLSKEPLRFKDEFVRHKILDIVGDLALFGRAIQRPRHRGQARPRPEHRARARRSRSSMRRPWRWCRRAVTPKGGDVLDVNDVMKLLPHRYPFLMVDRIVSIEGETKCTGVKSRDDQRAVFPGPFSRPPVMPGVLQLEAMAQVGSILLLRSRGTRARSATS